MSVYFATSGRYTKIGFSKDPIARSTTITISGLRPPDLPRKSAAKLLGWIPGTERREIEFHVRFAAQRVEGEWFVLDDEQLDEVRALIWADPYGIDLQRMSAMAVFTAIRCPELTRDDLVAAGVQVDAITLEQAIAAPGGFLGRWSA